MDCSARGVLKSDRRVVRSDTDDTSTLLCGGIGGWVVGVLRKCVCYGG